MGFLDDLTKKFKVSPAVSATKTDAIYSSASSCQSPPAAPSVEKISPHSQKDNQPLKYAYDFDVVPAPGIDVIKDILGTAEKYVKPVPAGNEIVLRYDGRVFGKILDHKKAEMLADWIRGGFPFEAILRTNGKVNLRFYKDKRKGNEFREQTVTALTAFKSESRQTIIGFLEPGEELEPSENFERQDTVDILYMGIDKIGSLPKKLAQRYINEGAYGVFYEKGEDTEDVDKYGDPVIRPYVRIYW